MTWQYKIAGDKKEDSVMLEICLSETNRQPKQGQQYSSGVFIVILEQI